MPDPAPPGPTAMGDDDLAVEASRDDAAGPLRLDARLPAGRNTWTAAAAAVLLKAGVLVDISVTDPSEVLRRHTVDGIPVPAVAFAADRPTGLAGPSTESTVPPDDPAGGWDIRSRIAEPNPARAAAIAMEELTGGASSLWVAVGPGGSEVADLPEVLAGVLLDAAPVAFQFSGDWSAGGVVGAAGALRRVADGLALHPDTNVGADPIGQAVAAGRPVDSDLSADLAEIAHLANGLGCRAVALDACVAHHAGAGEAQTIGYAIATAIAYARSWEESGLDPDRSLQLIDVRLPATDDLPLTIASFRAAQVLWARFAELSGVSPGRRRPRLDAMTSWPMLTRHDPWVNVVRNTVAAFAAAIAGARSVAVLPHDLAAGRPSPLTRRVARTISSMLVQESHVAVTANPATGAYAIDQLTADLAEQAWAEVGRIEDSGGVAAALLDGSLRGRWAGSAAERKRRVATRRQPITGVSVHPSAILASSLLSAGRDGGAGGGPADQADPLRAVHRWSQGFEELRDDRARVPVHLVMLDRSRARIAERSRVVELLEVIGVTTGPAPVGGDSGPADAESPAGTTGGKSPLLAAWRAAGSPGVICVVGDAAGDDTAALDQSVKAFRQAGAALVLLSSPRVSRGSDPSAPGDGPVDQIYPGVDLLALGRRIRDAQRAAPPTGSGTP